MRSLALVLLLSLVACTAEAEEPWEPQVGDVIFHTSTSAQSQAIQEATDSRWSHVGMLVKHEGSIGVLEAVQPVRVVTLESWLARGEDRAFAVYRSKTRLSPEKRKALEAAGREHLGKDYDLYFGWDDTLIYCSELVWKAYSEGLGIELSAPRPLADFDLSSPTVQALMKKRWPNGVPDQKAVSPQDLADSALLQRVAGSR